MHQNTSKPYQLYRSPGYGNQQSKTMSWKEKNKRELSLYKCIYQRETERSSKKKRLKQLKNKGKITKNKAK